MIYDKLEINNGIVQQINIRTGYGERPLWTTIESMPINQAVQWISRYAPLESLSAQWALTLAVEQALNIVVPSRAQALRILHSEVQRIIWCAFYMETIFDQIQFAWRSSRFARCVELGFQYFDQFLGARVLPHWFKIGGVQRDLSIGEIRKAKEMINTIDLWFKKGLEGLASDWITEERLTGVLPLSYEFMQGLMVGGPVGQASGLRWDLRDIDQYGLYGSIVIKYFMAHEEQLDAEGVLSGDVYLRMQSVIFQAQQSFQFVREIIQNLPEGRHQSQVEIQTLPHGFWTAGVEAPSGPMYASLSEGRIRLSSSSSRMAGVIDRLLVGVDGEDVDLAFSSLAYDPLQGDLL